MLDKDWLIGIDRKDQVLYESDIPQLERYALRRRAKQLEKAIHNNATHDNSTTLSDSNTCSLYDKDTLVDDSDNTELYYQNNDQRQSVYDVATQADDEDSDYDYITQLPASMGYRQV